MDANEFDEQWKRRTSQEKQSAPVKKRHGVECKKCGRDGFSWLETISGWRLVDEYENCHYCQIGPLDYEPPVADWFISLMVRCPFCDEQLSLFPETDLLKGKSLLDMLNKPYQKVNCPLCHTKFYSHFQYKDGQQGA